MQRVKPEQILIEQTIIARSQRSQERVEFLNVEANRQQFSATIIGFDATTGLYLCRLEDGTVLRARNISAGGSKGKGDIVSLNRSSQGLALIKTLS